MPWWGYSEGGGAGGRPHADTTPPHRLYMSICRGSPTRLLSYKGLWLYCEERETWQFLLQSVVVIWSHKNSWKFNEVIFHCWMLVRLLEIYVLSLVYIKLRSNLYHYVLIMFIKIKGCSYTYICMCFLYHNIIICSALQWSCSFWFKVLVYCRLLGPTTAADVLQLTSTLTSVAGPNHGRLMVGNDDLRIISRPDDDLIEEFLHVRRPFQPVRIPQNNF